VPALDMAAETDRRFNRRQVMLLITPPLLLATIYRAYQVLVTLLGRERGYLGGFLFYFGRGNCGRDTGSR
jgi:hypothetical protein